MLVMNLCMLLLLSADTCFGGGLDLTSVAKKKNNQTKNQQQKTSAEWVGQCFSTAFWIDVCHGFGVDH